MDFRFPEKMCRRKEPERGSLGRNYELSTSKGCSLFLLLPTEIRIRIFEYLVDEVDLIFRVPEYPEYVNASCWVSWAEYRQRLSFLATCRLFEEEGLTLVPVRAISIEIDPQYGPGPISSREAKLIKKFKNYKRSGPMPIGLRLEIVKPHLVQLSLDSKYTLSHILTTNLLDTFPKLRTICVTQTLQSRAIDSIYKDTLKTTPVQREIINESLREYAGGMFGGIVDHVELDMVLRNEKLRKYYPIIISTTRRSAGRFPDGCSSSDDAGYPIRGAVAGLRMTYQWPTKRVINLEVDLYNLPLPLAIKSQWTERISLTDNSD